MLEDLLEDEDFLGRLEKLADQNKAVELRKFAVDKALQSIQGHITVDKIIQNATKIETFLVKGAVSEPESAPANGDTEQN